MKGNIVPIPDEHPSKMGTYRHYKGDLYRVCELALHSDDEEWMVVYEAMYEKPDAHLFTLPLSKWSEVVEWNNEKINRFQKIELD